jgi:hypothetical protein
LSRKIERINELLNKSGQLLPLETKATTSTAKQPATILVKKSIMK